MAKDDDVRRGPATLGRIALLAASAIGALLACSMIAGIIVGYAEKGGGAMSTTLVALLAGATLFAALCVYVSYRGLRSMTPLKEAAPRDRRNVLTLAVAGALGGVIAVVMLMAGTSPSIFNDDPIPAGYAIALALLIGVPAPIISLYWHLRVADEQEAAAYNKGALLAIYAYWIGAPVWWLLWRGGLLPAPDGVAIYLGTIFFAAVVWLWAKYR